MVFPLPSQVAAGVLYGPNGADYVGTAQISTPFAYDITTGELVKTLGSKLVMTI